MIRKEKKPHAKLTIDLRLLARSSARRGLNAVIFRKRTMTRRREEEMENTVPSSLAVWRSGMMVRRWDE